MNKLNIKQYDESLKTFRVGMRKLSKEQLESSFPEYNKLFDMLKCVIENKKYYNKYQKEIQKDSQANLRYDNIFSILGGRGTGKSSVLCTVRQELEKNYRSEAHSFSFLPIIHPEIINERDSIMGWIISYFEDEVKRIEKIFQKLIERDENYQCMTGNLDFYRNCQFNPDNRLRKDFDSLRVSYFSRYTKENIDKYSYSEGVDLYADLSLENARLITVCSKFLDTLVSALTEIQKHDDKEDLSVLPAIFVFIDDLDLVPDRSLELISTIPKFLSHPRVFVIVTASPKMFEISTLFSYINRFNSPHDIATTFKDKYKVLKLLNRQLSDKIFPPSSRFYLRKYYSLKDKKNFRFMDQEYVTELEKDERRKIENVGEFWVTCIERIQNAKKTKSQPDNTDLSFFNDNNIIIVNDEKEEKTINEMFFSVLGNTPREICNFCKSLIHMMFSIERLLENNSRSENEQIFDQYYAILKSFLQNAIESNMELKPFFANEKFIHRKEDKIDLYIDYTHLRILYEQHVPKNGEHDLETRKKYLKMYILLSFVEYIALIIDPDRKYTHGRKVLFHFIENWDHNDMLFTDMYYSKGQMIKNKVPQILNEMIEYYVHFDSRILFSFNKDDDKYHVNSAIKIFENQLERAEESGLSIKIFSDLIKMKTAKANGINENILQNNCVLFIESNRQWALTYLNLLYFRIGGAWKLDLLKKQDLEINPGFCKGVALKKLKDIQSDTIKHFISKKMLVFDDAFKNNWKKDERKNSFIIFLKNILYNINNDNICDDSNLLEDIYAKMSESNDFPLEEEESDIDKNIKNKESIQLLQIILKTEPMNDNYKIFLNEFVFKISKTEDWNSFIDNLFDSINDIYNSCLNIIYDFFQKGYAGCLSTNYEEASRKIKDFMKKNHQFDFDFSFLDDINDLNKDLFENKVRFKLEDLEKIFSNVYQEIEYIEDCIKKENQDDLKKHLEFNKIKNELNRIKNELNQFIDHFDLYVEKKIYKEALQSLLAIKILEFFYPIYLMKRMEILSKDRNEYNYDEQYEKSIKTYTEIVAIMEDEDNIYRSKRLETIFLEAVKPIRNKLRFKLLKDGFY